jgi:hypothetical protein
MVVRSRSAARGCWRRPASTSCPRRATGVRRAIVLHVLVNSAVAGALALSD